VVGLPKCTSRGETQLLCAFGFLELLTDLGGGSGGMYDPPNELAVLTLLLSGTSEGLSRRGEGFFGIVGSETILPSLDLGRSITLLDAEWMLFESPQLTIVVAGDRTYELARELHLDWVIPRR
jgi:hypothetical protein